MDTLASPLSHNLLTASPLSHNLLTDETNSLSRRQLMENFKIGPPHQKRWSLNTSPHVMAYTIDCTLHRVYMLVACLGLQMTSRKVSAAMKDKISAATEQVSAAMKDKISAATEQEKELSENLKLRSDGSSEKARGNAGDNVDPDNSSVPGAEKIEGAGSTSSQESSTTNETLFSKFGKGISNAFSSAAAVLKSLKETNIMGVTKKGYDIVKEELTSTPSRRRRMQNAASASTYKERSSATSVVPVAVKQIHWGKSGKNLKRSSKHSKFIV